MLPDKRNYFTSLFASAPQSYIQCYVRYAVASAVPCAVVVVSTILPRVMAAMCHHVRTARCHDAHTRSRWSWTCVVTQDVSPLSRAPGKQQVKEVVLRVGDGGSGIASRNLSTAGIALFDSIGPACRALGSVRSTMNHSQAKGATAYGRGGQRMSRRRICGQ